MIWRVTADEMWLFVFSQDWFHLGWKRSTWHETGIHLHWYWHCCWLSRRLCLLMYLHLGWLTGSLFTGQQLLQVPRCGQPSLFKGSVSFFVLFTSKYYDFYEFLHTQLLAVCTMNIKKIWLCFHWHGNSLPALVWLNIQLSQWANTI